jgi:esterase/lipase
MDSQHMMELLLAMREDMKASNANSESMNAKMDANIKTTLNEIKEDMKTMQEKAEADRKREREEIKQEIRAGQGKIQENLKRTMEEIIIIISGVGLTSPGTAATSGLLYSPK